MGAVGRGHFFILIIVASNLGIHSAVAEADKGLYLRRYPILEVYQFGTGFIVTVWISSL